MISKMKPIRQQQENMGLAFQELNLNMSNDKNHVTNEELYRFMEVSFGSQLNSITSMFKKLDSRLDKIEGRLALMEQRIDDNNKLTQQLLDQNQNN